MIMNADGQTDVEFDNELKLIPWKRQGVFYWNANGGEGRCILNSDSPSSLILRRELLSSSPLTSAPSLSAHCQDQNVQINALRFIAAVALLHLLILTYTHMGQCHDPSRIQGMTTARVSYAWLNKCFTHVCYFVYICTTGSDPHIHLNVELVPSAVCLRPYPLIPTTLRLDVDIVYILVMLQRDSMDWIAPWHCSSYMELLQKGQMSTTRRCSPR